LSNNIIPILLVFLIIFAGYTLKNSSNTLTETLLNNKTIAEILTLPGLSDSAIPNSIYSSNNVNEVNKEMLNRSFSNYEGAKNPDITGFIPPYFAFPQKGSNDFNNEIGELSAQDYSKIREYNILSSGYNTVDDSIGLGIGKMPVFKSNLDEINVNRLDNIQSNLQATQYSSLTDIPMESQEINPLTGLPFERIHANMVPFFGSNLKQNIEPFANVSILDAYTGRSNDTFKHKTEVPNMFGPVKQDIHGMPQFTENVDLDRFEANLSSFKQNEKPFQSLHVPASIQGTISTERAIPKSIDELRTTSNPKITYAGRNVDGQKGELRGLLGNVSKNGVERTFEQNFENYLGGQSIYNMPMTQNNFSNIKFPTKLSQEYTPNPGLGNYGNRQGVSLSSF
jgi:hypothetical protein